MVHGESSGPVPSLLVQCECSPIAPHTNFGDERYTQRSVNLRRSRLAGLWEYLHRTPLQPKMQEWMDVHPICWVFCGPQQFWAHSGCSCATSATLCLQPTSVFVGARCLTCRTIRLQGPRQAEKHIPSQAPSSFPFFFFVLKTKLSLFFGSQTSGANTGDHKASCTVSTWMCFMEIE